MDIIINNVNLCLCMYIIARSWTDMSLTQLGVRKRVPAYVGVFILKYNGL